MKLTRTRLMAPGLLLLLGCQSSGSASMPARMGADGVSTACMVQMQNFISTQEKLPTQLTHAAFANDSVLSIAASPLLDAKGTLVQGRELGMPPTYSLSKSPAGCTITRDSDGTSAVLDSCGCIPLR